MAGHGNGNRIDMTGRRFGTWTVGDQWRPDAKQHAEWLCRCDCGMERWVSGQMLRAGHSKSCGCVRTAKQKARRITPEQIALIGKRWVEVPKVHIEAIAVEAGVSVTTVSCVARQELGLASRVGENGIGRAPRAAYARPERPVPSPDIIPAAGPTVLVRCWSCEGTFESRLGAPVPCPHCAAASGVSAMARSA